jgi:hypothetical protein
MNPFIPKMPACKRCEMPTAHKIIARANITAIRSLMAPPTKPKRHIGFARGKGK